jgi:hypothetical protein
MSWSFNPNLYPPDGYVFEDADGVKHRGDSWKDLFRLVREYRARNGKPPGDLEAEINTQQCAKTPGLCHAPPGPPPAPLAAGINHRVLNWLSHILTNRRQNGTPAHVSGEEAARRAAICAVCPRQQALSSACEACLHSIKDARKVILGEQTPANRSLHPCGVLGEDTFSSVHLNLKPEIDPALPPYCWRRFP